MIFFFLERAKIIPWYSEHLTIFIAFQFWSKGSKIVEMTPASWTALPFSKTGPLIVLDYQSNPE